jgi:hypothetical protein
MCALTKVNLHGQSLGVTVNQNTGGSAPRLYLAIGILLL